MSDSVDRVFAHALSTVRKLPNTGSARPPTADRLRLYGLYKQSMEGDVEGVMTRPSGSSAEDQAEAGKWDAWRACAGLPRTEAKRSYIAALISTMHRFATGTPEARSLVEELEFVWDQVRGNWTPEQAAAAGGAAEEEDYEALAGTGLARVPSGSRRDPATGLRVMRPMSDNDAASQRVPLSEDGDDIDDALSRANSALSRGSRSRSPSPAAAGGDGAAGDWRRRVTRALVQLTAEVSALRELADGSSTSTLGRYFARSRRRRRTVLWKAWFLLWGLVRRVAVDAAVVAVVLLVLRWRWRERAESWWELLGVWMGFVSDEVRGKLRQGVREGIKMGRGVRLIAGAGGAASGGGDGAGAREPGGV